MSLAPKQAPCLSCSRNQTECPVFAESGGLKMRVAVRQLFVLLAIVLAPTLAFAQAAIHGVVKDSSGALLPGVTVEAASPALIEKTRTTITDASGQYEITDLRPGVYSVTFNISGFATVKREGVELAGSFNATVNADMKVDRKSV